MPFNNILLAVGGLPVYEVIISSNIGAWAKSSHASHIPSNARVILRFVVEPGVVIQSTSPGTASVNFNSLLAGSEIHVFNEGSILGDGGEGNSGVGGDAIRATVIGTHIKLTNGSGNIWGGGGGGGRGGSCLVWIPADVAYDDHSGGGGGGGGAGGGAGGTGGSAGIGNPGSAGSAGTTGVAGNNGAGGASGDSPSAGDGGDGGDYGVAGSAGDQGSKHGGGPTDGPLGNGQGGGAAGYAVKLGSGTTIEWVSGSGNPNVKGTVGT